MCWMLPTVFHVRGFPVCGSAAPQWDAELYRCAVTATTASQSEDRPSRHIQRSAWTTVVRPVGLQAHTLGQHSIGAVRVGEASGQHGRRVGLYAGFCSPRSSRPPGRRPSIYDRRCRRPPAVYPRTRAGSPRTSAQGRPSFEKAAPLDLAPGGVYLAAQVTLSTGGLLHHRFTLTQCRSAGRFAFCGTVPRVTPGGR